MTSFGRYLRSWQPIYLFLAVLILVLIPAHSLALSDSQRNAFQSGIYYFNTEENTVCFGIGAGSGPLFGVFFPKADSTDLVARVKNYISKTFPASPLIELSEDFVKFGQQYNVNPAMIVGMAQRETGLGTTGFGRAPQFNVTNIRGNGPGGFSDYDSLLEGLEAAYKNLRTKLYLEPPSNFTTVSQVINRWAPVGDNNDPNSYTTFVNEVMQKILSGSVSAPQDVNLTTDSSCEESNKPGVNGWSIGGAHAMVNYDQTDPQWSSLPYGVGKTSIGASGCGPTSLAMIGATLLSKPAINPVVIADRYGAQYHADGTLWSLMPVFAADYSLGYQDLGTNLQSVVDVIHNGGLVLISVGPGYFTNQGHFMVIRAVTPDGTGFYLADPNGIGIHKDSETRVFSSEFLLGEGSLKHLWGYTPK